MTRHDDPDTTIPIAATLAQHQIEAHGMTYGSPDACTCGASLLPEPGEEDVRVRRSRAFAQHQAQALAAQNVPAVPAHVCTPAAIVYRPDRDLLAEAEARGYERGKRDALTEAADAGETFLGRESESGFAWDYLRARAAETPGGAA